MCELQISKVCERKLAWHIFRYCPRICLWRLRKDTEIVRISGLSAEIQTRGFPHERHTSWRLAVHATACTFPSPSILSLPSSIPSVDTSSWNGVRRRVGDRQDRWHIAIRLTWLENSCGLAVVTQVTCVQRIGNMKPLLPIVKRCNALYSQKLPAVKFEDFRLSRRFTVSVDL
jgi:hypothetical protein